MKLSAMHLCTHTAVLWQTFEVFGKMYGEKDALHEINKELFLEKMKEWGVEVEGLPKEE